MTAFRLADLVWASPVPNAGFNILTGKRFMTTIFADRQGVRGQITGFEEVMTKLLAEVMFRVPWAMNRFDPALERGWNQDREAFIAATEKRREEIQEQERNP
jgi:hypothetical protein